MPGEHYSPEQLARFKSQGTALIPTLSLFSRTLGGPALAARLAESGVDQLKAFSDNGGAVLFGTDVGFTEIYDTSLEYELMHRALSERQVLASLTTNPARYFKAANKGNVEQGFDADLVVLDGDPIADVGNLAKGRLHHPRGPYHLSEAVKPNWPIALLPELREKHPQ